MTLNIRHTVASTRSMLAAISLLIALQTRAEVHTFSVGGIERQALIVAPSKEGRSAPLIFAFHGHGGNMRQARRSFGVEEYWPEAIVVYPQGLPSKGKTDPEGKKPGWQQSPLDYSGRDLAFFDVMLSTLKKEHRIDLKRVYAMGHSNGGRFTYVLWSERGSTFAAVAPSASPAIGLVRSFNPIPAFITAGENDQIVPFASQKASIDAIRLVLKTDESKARSDGYMKIEPGPNGIELGTYIFPGPHQFPREAIAKAIEFFKHHAKTG